MGWPYGVEGVSDEAFDHRRTRLHSAAWCPPPEHGGPRFNGVTPTALTACLELQIGYHFEIHELIASPGKKSFLLRIDPELWAEIERLAAQGLRSTNAQVEYLLREALGKRGRKAPPDTAERDATKPQK
jgi:hypothetical protein